MRRVPSLATDQQAPLGIKTERRFECTALPLDFGVRMDGESRVEVPAKGDTQRIPQMKECVLDEVVNSVPAFVVLPLPLVARTRRDDGPSSRRCSPVDALVGVAAPVG